MIATIGKDNTLRFWNPADGKQSMAYGAGSAELTGVAVNPNNQAAYTTSADGSLKFLVAPPCPAEVAERLPRPVERCGAEHRSRGDEGGKVLPGTAARVIPLGGKCSGVVVSPGGERVLTLGPGKEVVKLEHRATARRNAASRRAQTQPL